VQHGYNQVMVIVTEDVCIQVAFSVQIFISDLVCMQSRTVTTD